MQNKLGNIHKRFDKDSQRLQEDLDGHTTRERSMLQKRLNARNEKRKKQLVEGGMSEDEANNKLMEEDDEKIANHNRIVSIEEQLALNAKRDENMQEELAASLAELDSKLRTRMMQRHTELIAEGKIEADAAAICEGEYIKAWLQESHELKSQLRDSVDTAAKAIWENKLNEVQELSQLSIIEKEEELDMK